MNQAAYKIGKKGALTLLPRSGFLVSELSTVTQSAKVSDIANGLKNEIAETQNKNHVYFCPSMSLIDVQVLQDQSKSVVANSAALIVSDKSKFSN